MIKVPVYIRGSACVAPAKQRANSAIEAPAPQESFGSDQGEFIIRHLLIETSYHPRPAGWRGNCLLRELEQYVYAREVAVGDDLTAR
jgi:hypothetical protein